MKIRVFSVGRKMPQWVSSGCQDYQRRLPRELQLEWVDIAPGNRTGNASVEQAMTREAEQMLTRLSDQDWVIALDEDGKAVDTLTLAQALADWQLRTKAPVFLIGGADGLSSRCLERANLCWSLSVMTFPHALVRVILAEQLYRAAMINANHPYHRA